jgi:hypothetical protein
MVMGKRFFVAFFLVLILTSVFAIGIKDYVVPSEIALGQRITASGIYEDGNNPVDNIKCSFYFINDANIVVQRATDEYTTQTGRFVLTPFVINEPTFLRGEDYVLRTECGTFSADKSFFVGQRQSIAHVGTQEFGFLTEPENTGTIFMWGTFLLILIVIIIVGLNLGKVGRG